MAKQSSALQTFNDHADRLTLSLGRVAATLNLVMEAKDGDPQADSDLLLVLDHLRWDAVAAREAADKLVDVAGKIIKERHPPGRDEGRTGC